MISVDFSLCGAAPVNRRLQESRHSTSGRIVCSRCQRPVQTRKPPHATRICDEGLALEESAATTTAAAPKVTPHRPDDWAARQRVRTVIRELRRPSPGIGTSTDRFTSDRLRFEPPHDLFGQIEQATTPSLATSTLQPNLSARSHQSRSDGSQIVAWLVVVAGILLLAGGLGLVGWSLSTQQMLYWNLALGLTLGGQGTLILGLVLVISRLWRNSRYATAKLQDVHARLGQVQHATETLAATRAGGAPAFYADLVRGASPHVLLANLKGQVDQLATRVSSGW